METSNKTILENSKIFRKQYCGKRITLSLLIIALSSISIIGAAVAIPDNTSSLYMTLMTLGVTGIVIGMIKIAVGDKAIMYLPTKSPVKKLSAYFNPEEHSMLESSIRKNDFEALNKIAAKDRNSGVRLDVAVTKDGKFATCQILKYIPYSYEPISDIIVIEQGSINKFRDAVQTVLKGQ